VTFDNKQARASRFVRQGGTRAIRHKQKTANQMQTVGAAVFILAYRGIRAGFSPLSCKLQLLAGSCVFTDHSPFFNIILNFCALYPSKVGTL
jgi:hypothetical protein